MQTCSKALVLVACLTSCNPPPADDPKHWLGGVIYASDGKVETLGIGPFYLTDVFFDGVVASVCISRDSTCQNQDETDSLLHWLDADRRMLKAHHGMRLWVPEQKALCFRTNKGVSTAELTWAGFRP